MKTCPFCAESIQDSAIVCKHCSRDLPVAGGAAVPVKRKPYPKYVLGALLVLLGVIVVRGKIRSAEAAEVAKIRSAHAAAMDPANRPILVRIASGEPVEIGAGKYYDYHFTLPERTCTLNGHIEGVSGGNKDFEGFILGDDDFKNWSTSHAAKGVQSGRVAAWSPSTSLVGPGKYHLVVSNAFSTFTKKVVTVTGAVDCPPATPVR